MSDKIKVGDLVEVLAGAKPDRIIGRQGIVVDLVDFPWPHCFTQADVKLSDRFGDKYAVRTTRLKTVDLSTTSDTLTMDEKNTKPTVIEGWAISQYPGGRFLFEDHKPSKMYKRASLVIDDKAVPLSVVVEMLRRISNRIVAAHDEAGSMRPTNEALRDIELFCKQNQITL